MKIKHILTMAALVATLPISAIDYTTAGNGTTYNLQTLATISGSGVTTEGNTFVVSGTCTIADGDHFSIDSGATIAFDNDAAILIKGTADLQATQPTVLTRHGEATTCVGIEIEDATNVTEVKNLTFEYVGLRASVTKGMNVSDCHFIRHNGTASSALMLGNNGASFHISDCTFDHCQKAAIGGAANYSCPLVIDNCTFTQNSQANGNVPQLNLTAATNVAISNCTVTGDPTLTMVGGIAIANWFGTPGMSASIEGCTITDNRYGITTMGILDITIADNQIINNRYEVNPNNGGSGISLYDPYYKQTAIITGNHIEGNLWGITVIGCGNVNLGKTEVDSTDPDYNPGRNVFANNGNDNIPYDLYNNSSNTVYAQGNLWGVTTQDKEAIEGVIYHKNDNPALGEVIFMPAADPAGISKPDAISNQEGTAYNLNGVRLHTRDLPHGLYIINGKKVIK